MLLESRFAVMISNLPSAFTSPRVRDLGLFPEAKVVWVAKEGRAVMVGKSTKFKPRVPVPVMPVTFTV